MYREYSTVDYTLNDNEFVFKAHRLSWYARLLFWIKWKSHFTCPAQDLRDVCVHSVLGVKYLVVYTTKSKVMLYIGAEKKKANEVYNELLARCYLNPI